MLPYLALDRAFLVFHTALILFNLLGWAWKRTRTANLVTLLATAFSWFVLGLWNGIGYCPCTEWHWQIRQHLGDRDLPDSYLVFLLYTLTGKSVPQAPVDIVASVAFFAAFAVSLVLNIRDRRHRAVR